MNKEQYETPIVEVVEFETEDVIKTSEFEGEWDTGVYNI